MDHSGSRDISGPDCATRFSHVSGEIAITARAVAAAESAERAGDGVQRHGADTQGGGRRCARRKSGALPLPPPRRRARRIDATQPRADRQCRRQGERYSFWPFTHSAASERKQVYQRFPGRFVLSI